MSHREIALELAQKAQTAKDITVATSELRQGDLIGVRFGNATQKGRASDEAECILAGDHGEHWLSGERTILDQRPPKGVGAQFFAGWRNLPEGGLLVHTDQPRARHDTIRLAPGLWWFARQREMSGAEVVPVKD